MLGADDGGEAGLVYAWSVASAPAGAPAVAFSASGTNAAKAATATFGRAGAYVLEVRIADAAGHTATSRVTVVVRQALGAVVVTPGAATLGPGAVQRFAAEALDQFGEALAEPPAFAWSVASGGGSVDADGRFTAPARAGASVVRAAAGGVAGAATATTRPADRVAAADVPAEPAAAAPGDYDGDGVADLAIYRPDSATGTSTWAVARSAAGGLARDFGRPGDIPVEGDFDGDGKADLAVSGRAAARRRLPDAAGWMILERDPPRRHRSSSARPVWTCRPRPTTTATASPTSPPSAPTATCCPGPPQWFILRSGSGGGRRDPLRRLAGLDDLPAPADYDGDGRADIATFRPEQRPDPRRRAVVHPPADRRARPRRTSPSARPAWTSPVPADYDGDGRADIATFRPYDRRVVLPRRRPDAGATCGPIRGAGRRPGPGRLRRRRQGRHRRLRPEQRPVVDPRHGRRVAGRPVRPGRRHPAGGAAGLPRQRARQRRRPAGPDLRRQPRGGRLGRAGRGGRLGRRRCRRPGPRRRGGAAGRRRCHRRDGRGRLDDRRGRRRRGGAGRSRPVQTVASGQGGAVAGSTTVGGRFGRLAALRGGTAAGLMRLRSRIRLNGRVHA